MKFKREIIIIVILMVLFLTGIIKADNIGDLESKADLETSIVLLKVQTDERVIERDPFFELLVLTDKEGEEYVLLPLNLLSVYFDMNVNFHRTNNLIIVSSRITDKEVKIDLKEGEYVKHETWSREAPLVFSGDFFVSAKVLEYLFAVKADWNSSYQELTITGDYFQPESISQKDEPDKTKEKRERESKQEEIIRGDDYSLGSFQYKVNLDYRQNGEEMNSLVNQNTLNIHGRIKDWAVSAGVETKVDFDDSSKEYKIPLVKAVYNEDNQLVILGDSEFDFSDTLGEKNLRGFYYKSPDKQTNKKLAYTSISGPTEEGSEVSLYVNGNKYKEVTVEADGEYIFDHIHLQRKRLNILRIVIEKPNGEKEEIVKKLAGSSKIHEAGTEEIEIIAGLYQDEGYNNWEGRVVGFKTSTAEEKTTFSWENIVKQEFDDLEEEIVSSSDLGLAARLGDRTVVDSDLFIVERQNNFEEGIESAVVYSLESGYIEGNYFYIPYEVHRDIIRSEGKGGQLIGKWDIAPKWDLNSLIGTRYLTVSSSSNQVYEGELSFIYQDSWRSFASITGRVERELFSQSKSIENVNRYGVIAAGSNTKEGFRGKGELGLFNNQVNWTQGDDTEYNNINLETELYKKIFNPLLLTNSFEASGDIYNGEFSRTDLETGSKLKWSPTYNTFFTIFQELEASKIKGDFIKEREKIGGNITHYLNRNNIVNLDLTDNKVRNSIDYKSYSLRIIHFGSEEEISVGFNRLVPQDIDLKRQDTFQVDVKKELAAEKKMDISLGKTYGGVSDNYPEYFIRVSLARAFGFVEDKIFPQEFRNNKHTSFITGYIYLDENNNKIMDENEEIIPGVRMKLDNLLTETNKSGQFKFNLTRPGMYRLNFDYNSLVADYTPVTKEKIIEVRENENMMLNYGLTLNGSISGKVFIDTNANGKLDKGEEPLSWVGFSFEEGEKITYTDKRGEFYFENVPLGEHELTIMQDSLPKQMKAKQGAVYKVKVTKDKLDVRDLIIPIVYDFEV